MISCFSPSAFSTSSTVAIAPRRREVSSVGVLKMVESSNLLSAAERNSSTRDDRMDLRKATMSRAA